MRYAIALAAIPVIAWACWPAREQPVAVKAVEIEGVRAQRADDESFGRRWAPVSQLAPSIQRVIGEERGVAAAADPPRVEDTQAQRRRPLRTRTSSLDVCARHRMHKVHYGRTWRCRR